MRKKVWGGRGGCLLTLSTLYFLLSLPAYAQGILTVTPTPTLTTAAGTGTLGYTGDNAAATSATLAAPSAVAYDAAGNLYIADALNHVVREVYKFGTITTIAGTGIEGYAGDGSAATAALLDTPTGVAVDSSGNIYIADSHNHRIRKVSAGIITTIAGTGVAGFSGDGSAATAAQLADPQAVAVDTSGNVYIADTNNQRIRKITGTTITTIAGDGEELFSGDGGTATAAVLDSPTGVAVDASGNVYIADRHNQRVREITGTTITTIAGSGTSSFSGGFSGDGSAATAATLAKPSGVSVDASGNVYIADTDNQRIREVAAGSGGAITTITGSGQQGFGGDTTAPTGVNLNMPKAVALDASGDLAIADKLNQRVRTSTVPTLTYANDGVGILSAGQTVTLSNTGTASITVAAPTFTGAFTTATGGSCSAAPVTLAAGASCTQNIAFLPTAVGAATGSVTYSGTGIVPQTILLAGTGIQTATTIALTSSVSPAFVTQPIIFSATVSPTGLGTPTGTVTFYDNGTQIGTPQNLVAGTASIGTTTLTAGTHSITVVYSGDTNYITSTSTPLPQIVLDFNFTIVSSGGSGSGSGSQTVEPGGSATYSFTIAPIGGPFSFPVTLSALGLPPGATATFVPPVITIGATAASFTMTIQTAKTTAALERQRLGRRLGGGLAMALFLLPFSGRLRRKARRFRAVSALAAMLLTLAALGGLTGCGSGTGFFGQAERTYNIEVIGTAQGTGNVTLQHYTTVTLTVE